MTPFGLGAGTGAASARADATRHACIGPSSGFQSNGELAGMQWPRGSSARHWA